MVMFWVSGVEYISLAVKTARYSKLPVEESVSVTVTESLILSFN